MKQLFKCITVQQRTIMEWLVAQGITGKDIAGVDLLEVDRVKITNPAGQHMILICDEQYRVGIDQTPNVQLTANKTNMMKLVKSLGYNPPKTAQFAKASRSRSWWLEWFDENGSDYRAYLSTSMGKPLLGMTMDGKWTCHNLTLGELQKCGLITVKDKAVEKC